MVMPSVPGHPPQQAGGVPPPSAPPDVLACEYVSAAVTGIWSPRTQVVLERRLWLTVLRAQCEEGLAVPAGALAAYARVVGLVDLDAIRRRERHTRHDLKARLEEFNALAGHQHIHKGLTSCDITDNVMQARVRMSLAHLGGRAAGLVALLGHASGPPPRGRGEAAAVLDSAGRRLGAVLERYPLRGIKGPVGTAQDMLDLLGGDTAALARVERRVREHLGFSRVLDCTGQVYFRSLDHEILCALADFTAAASAAARRAAPGACEAVACAAAFAVLARGYAVMAAQLAGEQWNEGDVSCSVVRRVALPGAVQAADAALAQVEEIATARPGGGLRGAAGGRRAGRPPGRR
ncbi:adenylosuccinate lyase [Streptomyces sp. NPDC050560]|uniref:adenylosuccinate lyase n=1 Tax=Streptomyces sp. NPDC050560 TaxID=3365630 RepID=UPI00379FB49D